MGRIDATATCRIIHTKEGVRSGVQTKQRAIVSGRQPRYDTDMILQTEETFLAEYNVSADLDTDDICFNHTTQTRRRKIYSVSVSVSVSLCTKKCRLYLH